VLECDLEGGSPENSIGKLGICYQVLGALKWRC